MKKLLLILSVFFCVLTPAFGQPAEQIIGVVKDKANGKLLSNVRVYYQDTIPLISDKNGKFIINMSLGEKLHFRKKSYAWHTETINETNNITIYLEHSDSLMCNRNLGKYNHQKFTDVIYDGFLVQFKDWNDACSTSRSEILSLETKNGTIETDNEGNTTVINKNRLMIDSIFDWNE
ncbi:MAG: hypothetical protein LBS54_07585 [Dysgonamonadaceae bacterium]|jgi:hypothetical protein|nr:hypothetical protein [Dysgonamonadaceae bacterium]